MEVEATANLKNLPRNHVNIVLEHYIIFTLNSTLVYTGTLVAVITTGFTL